MSDPAQHRKNFRRFLKARDCTIGGSSGVSYDEIRDAMEYFADDGEHEVELARRLRATNNRANALAETIDGAIQALTVPWLAGMTWVDRVRFCVAEIERLRADLAAAMRVVDAALELDNDLAGSLEHAASPDVYAVWRAALAALEPDRDETP